MEPLQLIVISDPTRDIPKFQLGMKATAKSSDEAQLAIRRVNTEIASLTGQLSAAQSVLSGTGGFDKLATGARSAAQASSTLAVASGLLAESEAKVEAVRAKSSLDLSIKRERSASIEREKSLRSAEKAAISEEKLNQIRMKELLPAKEKNH